MASYRSDVAYAILDAVNLVNCRLAQQHMPARGARRASSARSPRSKGGIVPSAGVGGNPPTGSSCGDAATRSAAVLRLTAHDPLVLGVLAAGAARPGRGLRRPRLAARCSRSASSASPKRRPRRSTCSARATGSSASRATRCGRPRRGRSPRCRRSCTRASTRSRRSTPDLILAFSDLQADITTELVKRGYPVFTFNQRSVRRDPADGARSSAASWACRSKAEALVAGFERGLDDIRAIGRALPVAAARLLRGVGRPADQRHPLGRGAGRDRRRHAGLSRAPPRPGSARIASSSADRVIAAAPEVFIGSWCGKPVQKDKVRARAGLGGGALHRARPHLRGEVDLHPAARPGGAHRGRPPAPRASLCRASGLDVPDVSLQAIARRAGTTRRPRARPAASIGSITDHDEAGRVAGPPRRSDAAGRRGRPRHSPAASDSSHAAHRDRSGALEHVDELARAGRVRDAVVAVARRRCATPRAPPAPAPRCRR